MVELNPVISPEDQNYIKAQLQNHINFTNSTLAVSILEQWYKYMPRFVKVLPLDYKRVLQQNQDKERFNLSAKMIAEYAVT
jgi:glutamate synthase domain-containing protein 3